MKKLYTTLALAAAVCCSASAVTLSVSTPSEALKLNKVEKSEKLTLGSMINTGATSTTSRPAKAAPAGTWNDLGKGTWREGLLTEFSDIPSGLEWSVTIEESATTPGYYRVSPYTDDSPIATMMDMSDPSATFYINATDPDKVYIDGDVLVYGFCLFSQATPENQWQTSYYGTLEEGVFHFPENSFAMSTDNGQNWYYANREGEFSIALPGHKLKDYKLELSAPFCHADGDVPVSMTVGADIASLRYRLEAGYFSAAGENSAVIAQGGKELPTTTAQLVLPMTELSGMYSLLLVGLDANGKVVANATTRAFGVKVDDTQWESCGNGKLTEAYFSSTFDDIDAEEMTVEVQRHKTQEGYYRVVEPFATHSVLKSNLVGHSSHKHYMYINATNPERVFIEASPTGIASGALGDSFIYSWAGYYVEANMADKAAELGFFGTLKDGVITMPDEMLMMGFSGFDNGNAMDAGENFALVLPNPAGVNDIEINGENGNAQLFNLQGVRVAEPAAGIYLRRTGSKVEKVVVK